jgi:hypothetical protein
MLMPTALKENGEVTNLTFESRQPEVNVIKLYS